MAINITLNFIDAFAVNAAAVSNGRKLAGSLSNLCVSEDETLIFGECLGSGKTPYSCSVDFINEANPIARCSCPSRQIPCKHAVALLFAYLNKANFTKSEIPGDVLSKREKIFKKTETKKKTETDIGAAPSKAKINSAVKRINQQLEGIGIAEKLLKSIVQTGLASIDSKMSATLSEQAKQLGNYHINGIQTAFNELLLRIGLNNNFVTASEQILYISVLLKKARTYLETKKSDESKIMTLSTADAIEEQIGYVWKLDELRSYGCFHKDVPMIQLGFYSFDDVARRCIIDESFFMCLSNGAVYKKINYRPYTALKHIKEDDSIFNVITAPEMFYYPGGLNTRCRWDEFTVRDINSDDLKLVISYAYDNFAEVIKMVKNQIKNPLEDKNPIFLLKFDSVNGSVISDKNGIKQSLSDDSYITFNTLNAFEKLPQSLIRNSALLVMFKNNLETGILTAKPLSLITDEKIIRFIF